MVFGLPREQHWQRDMLAGARIEPVAVGCWKNYVACTGRVDPMLLAMAQPWTEVEILPVHTSVVNLDPVGIGYYWLSWIRIRMLYTDPDPAVLKLTSICNFFLFFVNF